MLRPAAERRARNRRKDEHHVLVVPRHHLNQGDRLGQGQGKGQGRPRHQDRGPDCPGIPPEDFLGTADDGVEKHIEQELDFFGKLLEAKKKPLGAQVLRLYFTIHNPHDAKLDPRPRHRCTYETRL